MPRYLFNPATNYGSSGGGVTPVLLGGTGATTADGAASNLGFIKSSMVGVANGVASLDANGKLVAQVDWSKVGSGKPSTLSGYGITDGLASSAIGAASGVASLDGSGKVPLAQIPSGLGASITGPTSVYVNQVVNYTINNFSTFTTYTITAIGGTFTRTDATITFTTTASAGGAASITINGAVHTLTVLASSVVAPTVTSPANSATNVSLVPTFTSSAFAYLGLTQTQDSVRWEISTDTGFGTTVQTYEGSSNYTSWTPTSLLVNTTYYVRVKHHSSLGGWSNWSAVVSFNTIVSYGWVARLGGTYDDYFESVTTDISGNVYAVGYENSSVGTSNYKALITKWDASGNLTWQKKIGGASVDIFHDVACDSSGNVYAVGTEASTNGGYNVFITKWDSSGNLTWQRSMHGSAADKFYGVDIDGSGNIYAAGYTYSASSSYNNALITKWDASGNLVWQRSITDFNPSVFNDVIVDASGNIYAVGGNDSGSTGPAFITKWDASGNLIWQRGIGTGNRHLFYGVTCDNSGNIYATGYNNSSYAYNVALITKWDASGNLTWQCGIGNVYAGYSNDVSIDASGNLYSVGFVDTPYNGYITKWDVSGNLVWQRAIGGSGSDVFMGIKYDTSGNIYAVGYEYSSKANNDTEALITKLPLDVTNLPSGALTGTGMTSLAIATPTLSKLTTTLGVTNTTYNVSTSTLSVTNSTLTVTTETLTRYFSSF